MKTFHTAEPLSQDGGASRKTYLSKGNKHGTAVVEKRTERGKKKSVRNNPVNMKLGEEVVGGGAGDAGGAPGGRAEILLQAWEGPTLEKRNSVRRKEQQRGAVMD